MRLFSRARTSASLLRWLGQTFVAMKRSSLFLPLMALATRGSEP